MRRGHSGGELQTAFREEDLPVQRFTGRMSLESTRLSPGLNEGEAEGGGSSMWTPSTCNGKVLACPQLASDTTESEF